MRIADHFLHNNNIAIINHNLEIILYVNKYACSGEPMLAFALLGNSVMHVFLKDITMSKNIT